MHKRIFLRYFNACALLIFLTVFVLGTATTIVYTYQRISEQDRNMENAATKIASMLDGMPANYSFFVGTIMSGSIETVKETIDSDVVIINKKGLVVQSTLPKQNLTLAEPAVETVLGGSVYRRQSVFISEYGDSYTVGVPIRGENDAVIGGVFVSARQVRIGSELRSILLTYVFCGMAVLLLAVVILYFITRQITRPLNEMAIAARAYANGDFSKRISVTPDDELGALAATFNQMADNLDRLETMRRGFIADVSHELRTPMTTIGGFVDGILDGIIPPEEEPKYLQLVSDEVKRLSRMVNSLLDVARIQSGEISYRIEPFNLTEAVHHILLTMEDSIHSAGVELKLQFPDRAVYALGDRDAIHRVIYNLVDNAVKFTPAEGLITVSLYRRGEKLLLSVRNTGQGIPEQEVGRIFERFYKTDQSRGVNRKGVGLGLYLVKSIIDAHGEDIFVASEEGVFAEFSFTLKEATEE